MVWGGCTYSFIILLTIIFFAFSCTSLSYFLSKNFTNKLIFLSFLSSTFQITLILNFKNHLSCQIFIRVKKLYHSKNSCFEKNYIYDIVQVYSLFCQSIYVCVLWCSLLYGTFVSLHSQSLKKEKKSVLYTKQKQQHEVVEFSSPHDYFLG